MSGAQLAQTRQAFDREISRLEQGGYRPTATPSETANWKAEYERERVRLAKLLMLYRDLQDETEALRKRLADAEAGVAPEASAPTPTIVARRRSRRRAGPFQMNGYTLYGANAPRKGGGTRRFFFFAKQRPKTGRATTVPNGFEVRTTRSGLPVLKRAKARRGARRGRSGVKARTGRRTTSNVRPQASAARRPTNNRARALAYARAMKQLRARARKSQGGKGPIASRTSAKRLRAQYGYE
ncbi:MAG: hypothetical protein HYT80_06275 [Euryarchaeota archaeon]|nr:hypothetical protein [Euryarchaeota archaeon]